MSGQEIVASNDGHDGERPSQNARNESQPIGPVVNERGQGPVRLYPISHDARRFFRHNRRPVADIASRHFYARTMFSTPSPHLDAADVRGLPTAVLGIGVVDWRESSGFD